MDIEIAPLTPEELAESGFSSQEIAQACGMTEAEVLQRIKEVGVGPQHVARLEQAAFTEAMPGETWREASVGGEIVQLRTERRPNPAILSMLLKAHAPEKYGTEAGGGAVVRVDRMGYLRVGQAPSVIEGEAENVTPA